MTHDDLKLLLTECLQKDVFAMVGKEDYSGDAPITRYVCPAGCSGQLVEFPGLGMEIWTHAKDCCVKKLIDEIVSWEMG